MHKTTDTKTTLPQSSTDVGPTPESRHRELESERAADKRGGLHQAGQTAEPLPPQKKSK
jgi:hypothetical protein